MKSLKITDVSVGGLSLFLQNANINSPQFLDIRKDLIISRAHTNERNFVKMHQLQTSSIMKFPTKLPENFVGVKFCLNKLSNMLNILDIFNISKLDLLTAEFDLKEDKSTGFFIATSLLLYDIDKKLKIRINAGNSELISYMGDEPWKKFSSTDEMLLKFDINREFINKLKKLVSLDLSEASTALKKNSGCLMVVSDDGGIKFTSVNENSWSIVYDLNLNNDIKTKPKPNIGKDFIINVPIRLIDAMEREYYTLFLVKNTKMMENSPVHIYVLYNNKDSIYVTGTQLFDPNLV